MVTKLTFRSERPPCWAVFAFACARRKAAPSRSPGATTSSTRPKARLGMGGAVSVMLSQLSCAHTYLVIGSKRRASRTHSLTALSLPPSFLLMRVSVPTGIFAPNSTFTTLISMRGPVEINDSTYFIHANVWTPFGIRFAHNPNIMAQCEHAPTTTVYERGQRGNQQRCVVHETVRRNDSRKGVPINRTNSGNGKG